MPAPREPEGFSRDKDLERARGGQRPAGADMDATERSADPRPKEHIHHPADVEDEEANPPDRDALADSGPVAACLTLAALAEAAPPMLSEIA